MADRGERWRSEGARNGVVKADGEGWNSTTGVATERETWVGRAVPRIEDEALLRGEGSFMDDIDPVRNAAHAAILRSPLAHARIVRLDPSRALEHPGVVGVLTGADVQ